MLRRILKDFCLIWLCLLIVVLPGCSALLPWMAGEGASIERIELELDAVKAAARKADANADGKLSLNEALIAAGGAVVTSIVGTNAYRNRKRRERGEPVEATRPPAT